MPIVELLKFDGGIAEDIRTFATDQSDNSLNFDIHTNPHKLTPFRDMVTEGVTSGTLTDLVLNGIVFTGTQYVTVGRTSSGSAVPKFYTKTAITDLWLAGSAGAAGSTIINGTLILYQGTAYVLAYDSGGHVLLIDSTGTTKGTFTDASAPATYTAAPFIHPSDKKLYMCVGNIMAQWDGTTFKQYAAGGGTISLKLPADLYCTSLTDSGDYLAIAMAPVIASGQTMSKTVNSVTYLWDRQLTLVDANSQIDFGEGQLLILENLHNELVGIVLSTNTIGTAINEIIELKVYNGGSVDVVKSILLAGTQQANITNYKTKFKNGLYFALRSEDAIYVVKKNKEGFWTITKDRYIQNGVAITGTIIPAIINGQLWVSFNSAGTSGKFYRNWVISESNTFLSTSLYKTTINPSMSLSDRTRLKQLEAVRISYTGKTSGTVKLRYTIDGSTLTNIISETTTAIEDTKEASTESDGTVLLSGREIAFQIESTGGVEVKSIAYKYSILETKI